MKYDWAINEAAENEMQYLVQTHGLIKAHEMVESLVLTNEFDKVFFSTVLAKIKELGDLKE